MNFNRLRNPLSIGLRTFGILLLAGILLAACGDDDDDTDTGDDIDTSPTIELTVPDVGGEATDAETGDETATEADMESTDDEADSTGVGTEDDASATSDEDGTATEDNSAVASTSTESDMTGTGTAEDDDGTATGSESMTGTSTEEDDGTATSDTGDATGTESDDDATATEADGDVTATERESSADTAGIGDSVEVEGFTIIVEDVESIIGVPGVLDPASGHQFVALTVTIENTGGDPMSLLSALSGVYLETGDGEQYSVDLRANAVLLFEGDGIASARIESDSQVTGKIGFEIPEDVDELMLVIENGATGDNVMIDLTDAFAS